jgi:hypothetical protein
MTTLGLLKAKKDKTTQKERLDAQRSLAHFNIIQKMETTAWEPNGNRILILPSILAIISNQGINDMIRELDEFGSDETGQEENEQVEEEQEVNEQVSSAVASPMRGSPPDNAI